MKNLLILVKKRKKTEQLTNTEKYNESLKILVFLAYLLVFLISD